MCNFTITDEDRRFMKMACDLASVNVDRGGGPFGAVIVKDGELIATGSNTVVIDNDATAHAGVNAIRWASRLVGNFKLEGCVIYCSCEPCLMCLSAIYWAGLSRVYYSNTTAHAGKANFNDDFIYKEMNRPHLERTIPCIHMEDTMSQDSFHK